DLVHERLVFNTPAQRLSGKLMHYSYEDFETVLRKLDAYSTAGAQQRHAAGQGGSFGKALGRGVWAFFRTYVLRRGFLDGRAGFMIAVFNAETVYYRFLKLERLGARRS
ncbi:MAG TPA: glycosyltransferase family 2 protein, partial [Paraburkholderia sp.]